MSHDDSTPYNPDPFPATDHESFTETLQQAQRELLEAVEETEQRRLEPVRAEMHRAYLDGRPITVDEAIERVSDAAETEWKTKAKTLGPTITFPVGQRQRDGATPSSAAEDETQVSALEADRRRAAAILEGSTLTPPDGYRRGGRRRKRDLRRLREVLEPTLVERRTRAKSHRRDQNR